MNGKADRPGDARNNGSSRFMINRYPSLPSTNSHLYELAREGTPEWTVVIADEQTAGKGRAQRSWESRAGLGLWMSILLRPTIPLRYLNLVNLLCAASLATYIESMAATMMPDDAAIKVDLKWPNDLFIGDKKLCGILLEASFLAERLSYVVLGIGLNVNHRKAYFPENLQEVAVSLRQATGSEWNRDELLFGFLNYFYDRYYYYLPEHLAEIADLYMGKVRFVGEEIWVAQGNERIFGRFKSITPEGYLLLEQQDGVRLISTGDVFGSL